MKKLLLITLAALIGVASVTPQGHATLAYKSAGRQYGNAELITGYITATAADTTTTITGKPIDNRDGRIQSISAQINETTVTGTSPTITMSLIGSNDGTNWFTLLSGDATPVVVSTGSQTSASAAVFGLDSCQELRCTGGFPAFVGVRVVQGGTSPTLVGTVDAFVVRK